MATPDQIRDVSADLYDLFVYLHKLGDPRCKIDRRETRRWAQRVAAIRTIIDPPRPRLDRDDNPLPPEVLIV
jgi:hypothetical protein